MKTLLQKSVRRQNAYAGGLMILLGSGTVLLGWNYQLGSLTRIGPGALPVALGFALMLIGVLIAGSAIISEEDDETLALTLKPEWRGWVCVVAGPLSFILLGHYCGLAPAIFGCVFTSALGDRTATLRASLILATAAALLGVLIFSYGLKVPFPIFRWELT